MNTINTLDLMKNVLEKAGYEIAEDLDRDGRWTWWHGTAECQMAKRTEEGAVLDAWESAASYVNDVLGGHVAGERWDKLNIARQAKLILLCFENDDLDDDDEVMTIGLFSAIQESEILRKTLSVLGQELETGNQSAAAAVWRQAKQECNLGA